MGFPLCMCWQRVYPIFHANSTLRYFLSDPLSAEPERRGLAGLKETGNAVLPVWASRGKFGLIWSVLSIMSRWKGLDQITNLELITKVVAGLCFILSPTLLFFSLWWFLPPSVRLSQGSSSFSSMHYTGCFINSVSPDYTLSVSQGTLIGI